MKLPAFEKVVRVIRCPNKNCDSNQPGAVGRFTVELASVDAVITNDNGAFDGGVDFVGANIRGTETVTCTTCQHVYDMDDLFDE